MTNRLTEKGKIGLARLIENHPIDGREALAAALATPTPLIAAGGRPAPATPRGAGRAEDCLPLGVRPFGHFGTPEARP